MKIKNSSSSRRRHGSDIVIEYYKDVPYDMVGGNSDLITSNKPGYTDRSIFLPYYYGGTSGDVGYWSGSFNANSNDIDATACLWIDFDGYIRSGYCYRHWQQPVRPVCE